MRALSIALLAVVGLIVILVQAPAFVIADDAPPAAAPKAAPAEFPLPGAAYRGMNAATQKVRNYVKRRELQKATATDYLAKWQAAGKQAAGEDTYFLGLFQQIVEDWKAAASSFSGASANKGVAENMRHGAAQAEARLLANSKARDVLGKLETAVRTQRLLAYASAMGDPTQQAMRGQIEVSLGNALEGADRKKEAMSLRTAMVQRDPSLVGRVYRSMVWGTLGRSHAMADYDAIRKEGVELIGMLKTQQAKAVEIAEGKVATTKATLREANPDALDEAGNLKKKNRNAMSPLERMVWSAESQLRSARGLVKRMATADQPFKMLGTPVQEWTLEHAFGDTKTMADLKGKVVVMDFWATWCPWCIRSFPAIRDLLKEHGEKGLVFVGVTASSGRVYDARYDLDDDLKDKQEPGTRPMPVAQIANARSPADGIKFFEPEAYAAKEKEVIAAFIKNHAMTWPVVMIDKTEPTPKYALGGWPHAVIVDRAGRVRYFKSGALLRDRAEAVAKFAKVLTDLLAEEAPKSGQ